MEMYIKLKVISQKDDKDPPSEVLYLVKDFSDVPDVLYVLKEINTESLHPKEIQTKQRDIDFKRMFDSPYIIHVKESEYDKKNNKLSIVQEYFKGPTLFQLIREKKSKKLIIEETRIIQILIYLTLVIKLIHEKNVVHRNINSKNIFLVPNGTIKLGGFRASTILGPDEKTRTICGNPFFRAPEVWSGIGYTNSCDLWSLGVVIYELCALSPPFKGGTYDKLRKQVINDSPPQIPDFYSRDLRELIVGLLSKNPLKRPTCEEILNLNFVLYEYTNIMNPTFSPCGNHKDPNWTYLS
jgi:NIMA (never in mitosis gene a)-related kinase